MCQSGDDVRKLAKNSEVYFFKGYTFLQSKDSVMMITIKNTSWSSPRGLFFKDESF